MSIWRDDAIDWSTGDGRRAVQLFHRAYPEPADLAGAALLAGVTTLAEGPLTRSTATVAATLDAAARSGRLLGLAAVLLQDARRELFHPMLRQLLGEDLPGAMVAHLETLGVPRDPRALEALVTEQTLDELDRHVGFEAMNRAGAGLPDVRDEMRVLADALGRTALIRRNGNDAGTGFLVGPDLVLTAAHVLGIQVEDVSVDQFEVTFGYAPGWRSPAERSRPEYIEEILDWSPPAAQEGPPFRTRTVAGRSDELDYALLRLTRSVGNDQVEPGYPRGWYSLSSVVYQPQDGAGLAVFGHPIGLTMRRSPIADTPAWPPGNRVRYAANTLGGSSGGPVINRLGAVVALHHYTTAKNQNQGVPIWLIAQVLCNGRLGAEINQPLPDALPIAIAGTVAGQVMEPVVVAPSGDDPFQTLEILGEPIIDRKPLRSRLRDLACSGGTRTMVITGGMDSGISTSYEVLNHVASQAHRWAELTTAAPGGITAIKIDLGRYRTTSVADQAEQIMGAIYRLITGEILEERVAQVARQVMTFELWARKAFADRTRQWWVFVDSINDLQVDVSPMGQELLRVLLDLARDSQLGLRVVLAGRVAHQVKHRAVFSASPDEAYGLPHDEVKGWFQEWAQRQSVPLDAPTLDAVMDRLFPLAGRTGGLLALQLDVIAEQRKLRR